MGYLEFSKNRNIQGHKNTFNEFICEVKEKQFNEILKLSEKIIDEKSEDRIVYIYMDMVNKQRVLIWK